MKNRDRIDWLLTAIHAVEDLVQPKLEARRKDKADGEPVAEHDEELKICLEQLHVAAEELTGLRDRLAIERQRYAELFDFAPDAYLEVDSRWNIREANRAAASLLCCAQEHLVGKPLMAFVAENERGDFHARLGALQPNEFKDGAEWQATIQSRTGETMPASIRASTARDATGRLTGARCLIRSARTQTEVGSPRSADAPAESR